MFRKRNTCVALLWVFFLGLHATDFEGGGVATEGSPKLTKLRIRGAEDWGRKAAATKAKRQCCPRQVAGKSVGCLRQGATGWVRPSQACHHTPHSTVHTLPTPYSFLPSPCLPAHAHNQDRVWHVICRLLTQPQIHTASHLVDESGCRIGSPWFGGSGQWQWQARVSPLWMVNYPNVLVFITATWQSNR